MRLSELLDILRKGANIRTSASALFATGAFPLARGPSGPVMTRSHQTVARLRQVALCHPAPRGCHLRHFAPPRFAASDTERERPATRDPRPATRDPRPATRDPRPATRDPRPATNCRADCFSQPASQWPGTGTAPWRFVFAALSAWRHVHVAPRRFGKEVARRDGQHTPPSAPKELRYDDFIA